MLVDYYIDALIADEQTADEISGCLAAWAWAWWLVASQARDITTLLDVNARQLTSWLDPF